MFWRFTVLLQKKKLMKCVNLLNPVNWLQAKSKFGHWVWKACMHTVLLFLIKLDHVTWHLWYASTDNAQMVMVFEWAFDFQRGQRMRLFGWTGHLQTCEKEMNRIFILSGLYFVLFLQGWQKLLTIKFIRPSALYGKFGDVQLYIPSLQSLFWGIVCTYNVALTFLIPSSELRKLTIAIACSFPGFTR